MTELKVGDHVTVGPDDGRKVSWQIVRIDQATEHLTYATLRAALTGRAKITPIERLHPRAPQLKEKK